MTRRTLQQWLLIGIS